MKNPFSLGRKMILTEILPIRLKQINITIAAEWGLRLQKGLLQTC